MDEVSRAKVAAAIEARLSFGEAKTANGLLDGALKAIDGLKQFGIRLVIWVEHPEGDPDLANVFKDAHPKLQPTAEYPKWLYHNDQPALIVNDKDEQAALGEGWHDASGNAVNVTSAESAYV